MTTAIIPSTAKTEEPKIRITQVYDTIDPVHLHPIRVSRDVSFTPTEAGIKDDDKLGVSIAVCKYLGSHPSKKYNMFNPRIAVIHAEGRMVNKTTGIDIFDKEVLDTPKDLSFLKITRSAWTQFCTSRSPHAPGTPGFQRGLAESMLTKLHNILKYAQVESQWLTKQKDHPAANRAAITSDGGRHVMLVSGNGTIIHYEYFSTKEEGAVGLMDILDDEQNISSLINNGTRVQSILRGEAK